MIRSLWTALVGGVGTAILAAEIVVANWLRLPALARYCPRNPTWSAKLFLWAAGVKVELEGA